MAKKRQRKKVYKPPQPKLETQFNCPECGRKKVVEVHFNKRDNKGYLRCRACGEEYEGKLKRASEPIDIYYNWINHRDNEREKNNENNQKIKRKVPKRLKKGKMKKLNNKKMKMKNKNKNNLKIKEMMMMKKQMVITMKKKGLTINLSQLNIFLIFFR